MKRLLSVTFGLMLVMILGSAQLQAQTDRGTITGTVRDASGAVVPGLDVTARNMDTGVVTQTITNEVGSYTLPNIPIGRYEMRFSLTGFKTYSHSGLTLTVAQTLRLDVTLETGQINETVTVTADASLLKTDTPMVSTTIQSRIVTDLPLSFSGGRAIENFAYAITPAVEGNNWTSYIGGAPAFSKEVLIDGISATAQIQGHVGESSPTMESIEEFSVQTSGMSAQYGRTSGGVFNFALKSGTNDLRGSAFYYGRNEALNANTWMSNWRYFSCAAGDAACRDRHKRASDRQHLAGGSLGGPVIIPAVYDGRNRTFLFGAFEHYQQARQQLGSMNVTVPIPDFYEGNFSRLLTTTQVGTDGLGRPVFAGQIYDPKTLRQVGSSWVSDPFPGNIIPKSRMSGISGKIIELYRKHYQPLVPGALTQNSARTQYNTPWFHQTQLTIKGDHAFTDRNKLTGSLIWTQRPRVLVDQGGVWDGLAAGTTGGPFSRARKQEVTSRAARLANNWTIRPNMINTLSIAYNRYRNPSISMNAGNDWNKHLGLDKFTPAGHFPDIQFGSAVNGVGSERIGYSAAGFYVANTYIIGNSLDWVRGRHSMKMGVEFWAQQINSHGGIETLGFNFSPTSTGMPGYSWSNRIGFGWASFFLGEADSGSQNVPFDLYGRRKYISFYFQDDYKITPRLTLNLGMRWEQAQPYYEKFGRWANFNPDITNTNYNIRGALEFAAPGQSFEGKRDWKEFSPRLGWAYRLTDRAILRGGYGIFYIPLGINYWSGVPYGFAPGYRGTNTITSTGNVPRFNWDASGFPGNYRAPTKDPNTLIWGMVAIDPETLKQAYTHQYNVSLQYEFGRNFVVEATFMGNESRRLHHGSLRRNQPTRSAYESTSVNPFAWVSNAATAAAAGVPYPYAGFSGNAGFALMPFPHVMAATWGPLYYVGTPRGQSGYKSFQIMLNKRMSRGIATQVSYNRSRSVGNVETAFDETWDQNAGIQDIYNLSADAGTVLPYDRAHIVKGYLSYQLPFGKGRRFLADSNRFLNAILGNWDLTTIFRYQSGAPLAVSPNVSRPGWEGSIYANFNPSVDLSRQFDGSRFNPGVQNDPGNRYFNPAAFSNPTGNNLGNGKRRYEELRGFGYAGEDLGLLKYFHFSETASLQIRAELLNVFNRHRFADPGTGLGNANTFGNVTTTTGEGRVIQFGLRLGF